MTFRILFRTFKYLIMSFRLIEASAIFQRHIIFVLKELLEKEVLVYLNNILITSKISKEHKRLIERVYKLLAETDLHKKKEKCKYFQSRIKFLRYILTEGKIEKNSEKLKYIHN